MTFKSRKVVQPTVLPVNFDRQKFLLEYWQRRPLLIKSAGQFRDPISPVQLQALSRDKAIESRIVTTFGKSQWQLQHGPFQRKDFKRLADSCWTLLVQAVDQSYPAVSELKAAFGFISNWRIDDVMVSLAKPGAGVGPHFDRYDVFLLQGMGSRRWQIGERCDHLTPLRAGSELRIIKKFQCVEEFILNPGDILYLPPRIAHWGRALEDSLCYSIGFRAPSYSEIIQGFSDSLLDNLNEDLRYEDRSIRSPVTPGEIPGAAITMAFEQAKALFDDRERFAEWMGQYLTEAKYPERVQGPASSLSKKALLTALRKGGVLYRNPASRFAFHRVQGQLSLFVDGQSYPVDIVHLNFVTVLCNEKRIAQDLSQLAMAYPALLTLLQQLIAAGGLLLEEP